MNIKSFLNRTGLSQTELANELHTTQASISYWAAGKSTPPLSTLKKLILMGMTIAEIFDSETEAFIMKGKRVNKNRLSADVVETALSSVVNGDAGKITDKEACVQIVKIGLEELFGKKGK